MKLWAIVRPNGAIIISTIKHLRSDSIHQILVPNTMKWDRWDKIYRRGYRCKRITVTVEGES